MKHGGLTRPRRGGSICMALLDCHNEALHRCSCGGCSCDVSACDSAEFASGTSEVCSFCLVVLGRVVGVVLYAVLCIEARHKLSRALKAGENSMTTTFLDGKLAYRR